MKQFQSLSESEMEVMRVIWASPTPVTSAEMLERFSAKGWKIQTVSTFLTRLVDKGALKMEKRGRGNLYSPALTPEEYRRREARAGVGVPDWRRVGGVVLNRTHTERTAGTRDSSPYPDGTQGQTGGCRSGVGASGMRGRRRRDSDAVRGAER